MPNQQDVTGPVRDGRRPAFCFQTHDALDAIREHWVGAQRSTAIAVYVALTEAANRNGGASARDDGFTASRKAVAESIAVSLDTLDRYVKGLVEIGLVAVEKRKSGKVQLPNVWRLTDPGPPAPPSRVGAATPSRTGAAQGLKELPPEEGVVDADASTTSGTGLEPVPKLVKVDGRNLGYDALAEACGVARNPNLAGQVAAALNGSKKHAIPVGIRELVWRHLLEDRGAEAVLAVVEEDPERFERAVAAAVPMQARRYREQMPGATMSPTALAKHWASLDTMTGARAGVSGDEARLIAEDELRRIQGRS